MILGDVAFAMAAHRDGVLSVLRHRRRDRRDGEPERLRAEAERTAALAGAPVGTAPRGRHGGARAAARVDGRRGCRPTAGWEAEGAGVPHDAAELPWLGALLA